MSRKLVFEIQAVVVAVGESVNTGTPAPHAMNMNDVGVMKALCDLFLIRTFRKLGPPRPEEISA
jgi:hypothetical protein